MQFIDWSREPGPRSGAALSIAEGTLKVESGIRKTGVSYKKVK
ncbi:hypothetical protein LEP1GSC125_1254 [Leptospira mayottensis 200901122]|uniref:Uncharacterized protein n=1 Tax=Leptospira mayottensis 200901122 TaxID=1193010 RepID=A0AA87SUP5_9LEPT|nr:hypothetical protein LEP1GSC125_1254 [Leptospira mayottensis 200901122]